MHVLVTGGAGFIGSHAALRLLDDGHRVTIVDNFRRGHRGAVTALLEHAPSGHASVVEADVRDEASLRSAMADDVDLVMHFAALTYVGESVDHPLDYHATNAGGVLAVLRAMQATGVTRLVHSSTAATYGEPSTMPIAVDTPQRPINPYGRSKLAAEWILEDARVAASRAGEDFAFAALRYFNVAGCDAAGRLGEDHRPETHLVPICLDAALERRAGVKIFGDDYPTPDGTCVRDYVHVEDLVEAHLAVLPKLAPETGAFYNVGIGRGYSVREVVEACRRVSGVTFEASLGPRRAGDPPELTCDPSCTMRDLGWRPRYTELEAIVETAWAWRRAHPDGYGG